MATFKLIKSTDWTSSNGDKGTTLVVAFQGRVFTCNQDDFSKLKISADKKTVDLGEVPVVTQESYVDAMGNTKIGLRLKPKCNLEFSQF